MKAQTGGDMTYPAATWPTPSTASLSTAWPQIVSLSARALLLLAGRLALALALAVLVSARAQAGALTFVEVGPLPLNCALEPICSLHSANDLSTIPMQAPVWTGTARLATRVIAGAAGSIADGLAIYEYRVDLTQAVSDGEVPCVTDVTIDFGVDKKLAYGRAGHSVDVFVVKGVGTIGLFAVEQRGNRVTFVFSQPVCAGPPGTPGRATHFFGLASSHPPKAINASVSVPGLDPIATPTQAPNHPRVELPLPLRQP